MTPRSDEQPAHQARMQKERSVPEIVHVLWTGGWDSTYRVMDLMAQGGPAMVQPHYVINPERLSHQLELAAIRRIRERAIERWGNRLLAPKTIELDQIPVSEPAQRQHDELAKRFNIGPQYLWLAEYARSAGISRLELCIHIDDKAYRIMTEQGVAEEPLQGHADPIALFRERFSFPILNLTKLQMRDNARAAGFEDLMNLTWFCQIPAHNSTPCGFCNPCQWTIKEGLAYRVPRGRRVRLAIYHGLAAKLPSYRLRQVLLELLRR